MNTGKWLVLDSNGHPLYVFTASTAEEALEIARARYVGATPEYKEVHSLDEAVAIPFTGEL